MPAHVNALHQSKGDKGGQQRRAPSVDIRPAPDEAIDEPGEAWWESIAGGSGGTVLTGQRVRSMFADGVAHRRAWIL